MPRTKSRRRYDPITDGQLPVQTIRRLAFILISISLLLAIVLLGLDWIGGIQIVLPR